jgi:RimJ/RimL family protein N-acetyltransferase
MTEALKRGILWIFERPDISALLAETTRSNLPSHRVLEKVGMVVYKETDNGLWWRLEKCA